jgi:DNA-directed RNA polymerase specialized sigma24 family protein
MADEPSRLEAIPTRWTLLDRAHHGGDEQAAAEARARLLESYGGAVRRYLLGALRDADAADELFQEFAYRFLHGDFRSANPERGRFRDYLKGVISHLSADHFQRRKRQMPNLPQDFPEPAAAPVDLDRVFQESWRDELLARTWRSLEDAEKLTGQPFHTVLRFRADHPDLRSPELARQLSESMQRPLTAAGVRQLLHRSREKYADLLKQHVLASLSSDDPDALNEELRDLGLLPYVQT